MNLDKDQLARLHAGEIIEVNVKRTYQVGRSYKTGDHRFIVAEVLDEQPVGFIIRVKLDRSRQDEPRLLHRRSQNGYTATPSMALNREPEAVDRDTQDRITKDAWAMDRIRRAEQIAEQEIKTLARRLRQEGLEAIRSGEDLAGFRDRIRRELDGLRDGRAA